MMLDFKTTTALVKYILTTDPKSRNSDSRLYLKVISEIAERTGINLHGMSVPLFLEQGNDMGFVGFETVRRSRQKLQQHHPYLASTEPVKGFRTANESAYRAFARGDV